MKITIVPDDNAFGIDGAFINFPMAGFGLDGIHAIQADDTTGIAEIEYLPVAAQWDTSFNPPKLVAAESKPANEVVSIPEFRRRFGRVLAAHKEVAP